MITNMVSAKYWLIGLLNCLVWSISLSLNGQTLHAVVVIQENVEGSRFDKERIENFLEEVANCGAVDVNLNVYSKSEFRPNYISSLDVDSDDVVWFYYSGHGSNAGDGFPMYNTPVGSISQVIVHDAMGRKSPRLYLTTFDCCNIGTTASRSSHENRTLGLTEEGMSVCERYQLLFNNTHGDLIMASCSDGQYSYGSNEFGGFFSSSFFESINHVGLQTNEMRKNVWKNILIRSRKDTNLFCEQNGKEKQNPKFRGNVSTNPNLESSVNDDPTEILFSLLGEIQQQVQLLFEAFDSENLFSDK